MDDKACPLDPQEIARRLSMALGNEDPKSGYHPRKGYRQPDEPKEVGPTHNGFTMWHGLEKKPESKKTGDGWSGEKK